MLSRSEIRERAMSNAYSRGLGIAREEGSVFDRGKFKSDKTTLLKAQVKSASGNGSYKATLELNRSETMISSYTCTCAAYEDYGIYGMCKHCVALALAYREDASSFAELEEAEDKPTPASGNAVDAGTQTSAEQEQVVSPQRTSPLLADYLDNATKALVSARTQPVSLGLVLRAGSSRWEAEFTLQGAKRA